MEICIEMVQRLINEQYPEFMGLNIKSVEKSGHDNRTFHLGEDMIIRLPSGKDYAMQAKKENQWLLYLAKHLSLPISKPLYLGKETEYYPYPWSILSYLEGETLSYDNIENQEIFAVELRKFLDEFQQIPCENGPDAGKHNFYRGGNLKVYNHETVEALNTLSNNINNAKLLDLWHLALASNEQIKNMWVHGDVAPGNLLIKNGHLCAVIDFGILGVGDPACDYAMAWTFFNSQGREVFLKGLSQAMRNRAMGWALWKALITYESDEEERRVQERYTIAQIEKDYD